MDIDTPGPPGADADASTTFSLVYPLPFRILTLISLGVLAWATNVHGVTAMGIDAGKTLDVRIDDLDSSGAEVLPRVAGAEGRKAASEYLHPSRLYPPAYHLFLALSLWTLLGWSIFHFATQADASAVSRWTLFPFLWAFVAFFFLVSPWTSFLRRERTMTLRSFRRISLEGLTALVPFCDVLMADVMTSFAKVMGDCWVSGCLAFAAERGLASEIAELGCYKEFMVPFMTSLPYIFRLRQCLAEYFGKHTTTPQRSLLNALKYASAFPVIVLSALQGVYGDPYVEVVSDSIDTKRGYSAQQALFHVWVLAVFVNSLYSFWWDVTNDWGLGLLAPTRPGVRGRRATGPIRLPSPSPGRRLSDAGATARWAGADTMHRTRSASVQIPIASTPEIVSPGFEEPTFPPTAPTSHSRAVPARHHHHRSFYLPHAHARRHSIVNLGSLTQDSPYLRSTLLLPDPLLYWLAIAIDLLLRFTWSLKLSSHLHEIHEIESGVFAMEALEVARRWMWTFLRIEWEAVKKSDDEMPLADALAVPPPDCKNSDYETDDSIVVVERVGLGSSAVREKGEV